MTIGLHAQAELLEQARGGSCIIREYTSFWGRENGVLEWFGVCRPTEESQTYFVLLSYTRTAVRIPGVYFFPFVRILYPQIEVPRERLSDHHVYSDGTIADGALCLHLNEWDDTMPLTDILAWTSEWLLQYEYSLGAGDWTGDGEHPLSTGTKRSA